MSHHWKIIALLSAVIWLGFVYSAFLGFYYWYAGFVFFLWLALASLNYDKKTTLWHLIYETRRFFLFYATILVLGFFVDFVVGQRVFNFWGYPHYQNLGDWLRLYFIIYPIVGLTLIEMFYFLANIFGERVVFNKTPQTSLHRTIDKLDLVLIWMALASVFTSPLLLIYGIPSYYEAIVLGGSLLWVIVGTMKLKYHIKHWSHWVAIILGAYLISTFLHEIPNTAVYEWRYINLPFWSHPIFGVPVLVIIGWYLLVIASLRCWIRLGLGEVQK